MKKQDPFMLHIDLSLFEDINDYIGDDEYGSEK